MLTIFKYRLFQTLRKKSALFWAILFPIILATFFNVAFAGIGTEKTESVSVAVVKQEENRQFEEMIKRLDGDILNVRYLDESKAEKALLNGDVKGIYFEKNDPSLTISGNGIDETMLSAILDSVREQSFIVGDILKKNPEKLKTALQVAYKSDSYIEQVSLGGRNYNWIMDFFFALIAMACLYGAMFGIELGKENAPDISLIAARRSIAPVGKAGMIAIDMTVGILVQFVGMILLLLYLAFVLNIDFSDRWGGMLLICLLGSMIGVTFGIVVGAMSSLKQWLREMLVVVVPLFSCFLAGLMVGNMKTIIENNVPIINRINPAALISDAFYFLNVYDDPRGMSVRLVILAIITAGLTLCAILRMRRDRYDSI